MRIPGKVANQQVESAARPATLNLNARLDDNQDK